MSNKAKWLIAVGAVLLIALIISVFYFSSSKNRLPMGPLKDQT
jgi:hypothetical protein